MEKNTDKAVLIVSIENENRLRAGVTDDFFLVNVMDYKKAVDALKKYENGDNPAGIVDTTSGAMSILNNAKIDYEHIIEGRRFFFSNDLVADKECDCK
jgi:Fe-S cluster assembly iron-binding protein IscA